MPRPRCRPGSRVADLRAGHQRRAVAEAGGGGGAARALGDVLVDLAVLVGARPEALDRGVDHRRVQLLDALPGVAHAVEHAGAEVLDQHVARLDQPLQHLLALRVLGVERDGALVVVQHREIEAVRLGHVLQLAPRDVADARPLDLDHVGAEPGEQLRARRPCLHVAHIQDADAFQCLAHQGLLSRIRLALRLCSQPIKPRHRRSPDPRPALRSHHASSRRGPSRTASGPRIRCRDRAATR